GELHLAEESARNQHRRHAADLVTDEFPLPTLLTLDVKNFFREVSSLHDRLLHVRFSGHLLGRIDRSALRYGGDGACGSRRFAAAQPHYGHVTRIKLPAHFGEKRAAAADQKINHVVAVRGVTHVSGRTVDYRHM